MATTAMTRVNQATACLPTLCLAFELGVNTWKLGFTTGAAQRPRERHVPAGEGQTVLEERGRAKHRFGWPEEPRVVRGYEAGREGCGLHRFFVSQGVANAVVDSARLEGHRRSRRATPARREVPQLHTMRRRQAAGAKQGWRVVRGPSVVAEARRQRHRDRLPTQRDRPRVLNRLKGRLAGSGIRMTLPGDVEPQLEEGRQGDGTPLPPALRARLQREWQQGQQRTAHRGSLEAARRAVGRPSEAPVREKVRPLATLRGIGINRAWRCVREFFAWRALQTPPQVGA